MAEHLLQRLHLNPAHHYPRIFLEASGAVTTTKLWLLCLGAAAYATIRFVEAYGLWRERTWAEWFAVVSASLYLPFELFEIAEQVTPTKIALITINLVIIFYLARMLFKNRRHSQSSHQ